MVSFQKASIFVHSDRYEMIHVFFLITVLVLLLVISSFHEIGGYNVETDFYGSYAPNVEKMLHGGKYYDEDHGPGYIFPLILFYLILGDVFVAGKTLTLISAILFLFFSFKTIKTLFDSRFAFYTSLLLTILILPYSILASTDMFFAFIVSLAIYFIFRGGEFTFSNMLWGGIVAGYAFMTRLNAIILPIAIIFSIFLINPQNWSWKQKFQGSLILVGAMLLGSLPWYIMNFLYYGKIFVSAAHETIGASLLGGEANSSGDFAWGAEKEKIAKEYSSLFSLTMHNLPLLIKSFLKNTPIYFRWMLFYLIGFPGFLFVAPGIILLLTRANKRQLSYFTIPLFGFLIYCIVSFISRFYLYILGFFVFFIIYFLFDTQLFKDGSRPQKKFSYITKVIFLFVVLFSIQRSLFLLKKNITNEPVHIKKIAQILEKHSSEDDIVFARKPHLGYFSHRKIEIIPDVQDLDLLIKYAKEKGVKFVYYGIAETKYRPDLNILQHPKELPPAFQLLYASENPKAFLYKIKPQKRPSDKIDPIQ